MKDLDRSTLAGFRLLVAMAQADGNVDQHEIDTLTELLGDRALLDQLLAEQIDVDAEVEALGSQEARERVYRSAFTLAYVDDHMAHAEVALLEKIWPDHPEDHLVAEVFNEVVDTLSFNNIKPVADPAQRAAEIEHDTLKYAIMAAVVGATPIPVFGILADAAVVAIQIKLVRDIGQYWGHTLDGKAARSLMMGAAGGIGMQIAINNLARFVPGYGSLFAGGSSFATTFAIGRVIDAYFAQGRGLSEHAMRDLFKRARQEGRSAYAEQSDAIERTREAHGEEIQQLAKAAADDKISKREFEQRVLDTLDRENVER